MNQATSDPIINPTDSPTVPRKQLVKSDPARILTAVVGMPIVIFIVWLGGALFAGVVGLLALLAMRELVAAHRKSNLPLVMFICYPALLGVLVISWWCTRIGMPGQFGSSLVIFSFWLVPVLLLLTGVLAYGTRQKVSISSLALTQLAISYTGLFAFLILLREFPGGGSQLFSIVLVGVWTGDSCAYFFGRAFGKRPLTVLSPKKTLEGSVAGVASVMGVCLILAHGFGFAIIHGLAIGALIAVAAPLGDLAESFWKRELEIKDLGALLPGHGGVLDRSDSLLFASFAVYLYALWQLSGH